VAFITFIKNSF